MIHDKEKIIVDKKLWATDGQSNFEYFGRLL